MSGPTPVKNSRMMPMGTIHLLKKGGPTVMRSPSSASDRVGNIVANMMKNAANSSTQLLTVNAASRDSHDSNVARERSSGMRLMTNPKLTTSVITMKMVKIHASFVSWPNACTDCTMPDRVMNVPKMVRKNVVMISDTFQIFIIPRRSWIMIECRNAVAVSQGRKPAFSTGSQPQKPPQPSSSYAHSIPSVSPIDRKNQAPSVHLRTDAIHVSSSWPEISAPIPNANGMLMPTKPV